jgi:hypothetical protein
MIEKTIRIRVPQNCHRTIYGEVLGWEIQWPHVLVTIVIPGQDCREIVQDVKTVTLSGDAQAKLDLLNTEAGWVLV